MTELLTAEETVERLLARDDKGWLRMNNQARAQIIVAALKGVEPKQDGDSRKEIERDLLLWAQSSIHPQGPQRTEILEWLNMVAASRGIQLPPPSKQEVAGVSEGDIEWQAELVRQAYAREYQRGFEDAKEMACREVRFSQPWEIINRIRALTPNTDMEDGMSELQRLGQEWDASPTPQQEAEPVGTECGCMIPRKEDCPIPRPNGCYYAPAPAKGEDEIVTELRRVGGSPCIEAADLIKSLKEEKDAVRYEYGVACCERDTLKAQVEKALRKLNAVPCGLQAVIAHRDDMAKVIIEVRTALAQTEGAPETAEPSLKTGMTQGTFS